MSAIQGKRKSSGMAMFADGVEQPPTKKSSGGLYDSGDEEEDKCVPRVDDTAAAGDTSSSRDENTTDSSNGTMSKESDAIKEESETGLEPLQLLSVLGCRRGEREDMQDAHLLLDNFALGKPFVKRCSLYAIFDGHAGARAAKYCEEHIPSVLMKKKPVWKDGTTVTCVLILNDALYVANIGDSKAIVCRKKDDTFSPIELTVDHNPTMYEERMRIQKAGGTVKDGRVNGIIEVSRSIGDGQFKAHGVTCIPDMKKLTITPGDRFLIVACDGLWKSFSNEEAIKYVNELLEKICEGYG
ncbi:hypothetical protein KIN20_023704 [Parelaphostrongylus tenuis]|uniref:PPM-type phosphatase domain-containing protein n=1 Tax=Parelaphostrongylus tenuis TaxID=148309 RepID=A0AAD5MSB3_PARTN|nr:hypothetical protein KIN20_023704 [Parelaphostrongylus tenuis]